MYFSIRTRLILYIIPVIIIIAVLAAVISYNVLYQNVQTISREQLKDTARRYAAQFDADMKTNKAIAYTIVNVMEHYKGKDRNEVGTYLKAILDQHPKLLGTYVAFEPNIFDGKDRLYLKDTLSYYGRFGLYWNRVYGPESVKACFTPLEPGQPEWDWYAIPRDADSMVVMEPYLDEGVIMTSCIAPIHYDGKFAGIGGVDILLNDIDTIISEIKVMDQGYAFLISREGKLVSFREKKYIGDSTIADFGNNRQNRIFQTLMDSIRVKPEGQIDFIDPFIGSDAVLQYAPVETGHWTFAVVAAKSDIFATVYAIVAVIGIIGAATILLILLTIIFLSGKFSKPIWHIATMMDQANLNMVMNIRREDEIGYMSRSFDKFVGSVRKVLIELMHASNTLSASAKEISASTDQIALEARKQSAQTAGAATAIEEMTRTIYQNAQNTAATKDMAVETHLAASDAMQVIDQTVSGMNKIAESVKKTSETIHALSLSSAQIGKITQIITEVTKQTNLIALNASVEAVRAGDKGKGFTVVAYEIQKLAERTGKSTLEINELIAKMQSHVQEVTGLMESGKSEVEQGLASTDRARNALQQIVDTVQKLTNMISQIAVASNEQSTASEQVAENIKGVDSATQQIAGSIRQIANASEDLEKLTGQLQILVSYFKLEESGNNGRKKKRTEKTE